MIYLLKILKVVIFWTSWIASLKNYIRYLTHRHALWSSKLHVTRSWWIRGSGWLGATLFTLDMNHIGDLVVAVKPLVVAPHDQNTPWGESISPFGRWIFPHFPRDPVLCSAVFMKRYPGMAMGHHGQKVVPKKLCSYRWYNTWNQLTMVFLAVHLCKVGSQVKSWFIHCMNNI